MRTGLRDGGTDAAGWMDSARLSGCIRLPHTVADIKHVAKNVWSPKQGYWFDVAGDHDMCCIRINA